MQDQIASNPSCVDGCIYQEVDNPFSYACFVDAFNEVGCSVNVEQPSKYFMLNRTSKGWMIECIC